MKKSEVFVLFLFAFLFSLPLFLSIPNTFPRLDSDYDAVLPIYQYIGNFIRLHHVLPTLIPFVGTGIPLIGDPISGIYNPILLFPLIFFDVNVSIRITIFLVIFFSGITQFIFLQKIKISKFLSFWGAMLYMTSGVLIAAVAAGHITEKFLTLPVIPLFFCAALASHVKFKKYVYISFAVSYAVYSGDLYIAWFFFIIMFSLELFFFIQQSHLRKLRILYTASVLLLSFLFSLLALYSFLTGVLPIMKRPTFINPFLGSIHAIFLPLQFLVPFQVDFYDRPFFQRHIGFYYNWYEYYGFLGLIPVIFLKNIKKVFSNPYVQKSLFILFIGSLYLAAKYFYSPFHWILLMWHNESVFRVPQRIVIPLTPIAILLFCLTASYWKNKMTLFVICFGGLLWTFLVGWHTFSYTFISLPKEEKGFIEKFSAINTKKKSVVNFVGKTQLFLSEKNIPITNYYYAWVNKNTPFFTTDNGTILMPIIKKEKPQYVLASTKIFFTTMGYRVIYSDGTNSVWEKED